MTNEEIFDIARKMYPGKRKGLAPEFANFVKRSKKPAPDGMKFDVEEVLHMLEDAIKYQIAHHKWATDQGVFIAPWKNFQTWINKNCWDEEWPDFSEAIAQQEHEDNELETGPVSAQAAKSFWE
jgi:hypothetical protein